jgi:NADPH:quinone reductase-like Zn-dependent oxidoreductase
MQCEMVKCTAAALAALSLWNWNGAKPSSYGGGGGGSVTLALWEVGALVEEWQVGDEVVAVSPLDTDGGCAEYCVQNVYNVASKPTPISHEDAAASLA